MDDFYVNAFPDASRGLQCMACGREFNHSNAYSNHIASCRPQKRRISSALDQAKQVYRNKKVRLNAVVAQPQDPESLEVHVATPVQSELPSSAETAASPEDSQTSSSLAERRPRRENRRMPLRYREEESVLLLNSPPVAEATPEPTIPPPLVPSCTSISSKRDPLDTKCDSFGLFRRYHAETLPSHDPEAEVQPPIISNSTMNPEEDQQVSKSLFKPYPNQTAFLLGEWYWNGGIQKSQEDFKRLINIICDQSFTPADIVNVPWDAVNKSLGEPPAQSEEMWFDEPNAGWREAAITLSIPFPRNAINPGIQEYTFPPFRHRSIVSVLKEKMANEHDFRHFHLEPYELRWRRKGSADSEPTIRVHGELYTSPAFLETHEEIQRMNGEPECSLPRVLVGILFGSDGTHLTSFGNASLWPCYMYFGNESKYRRCKPTHNLCNHIAYFQKLPPSFKDFAASLSSSKGPSEAFMTHCHREFFHAQWRELLSDEFLEAYEHGVVIKCCDGVTRRFYPRIFAYTADYPEKVLLSSIRNMGKCPCPRCLIPKDRAHLFGTKRDKKQRTSLARVDNQLYKAKISSARDLIYVNNRAVDSVPVQTFLKAQSLVPTENAFSTRLSCFGFNLFSIFPVDLMHEFELGVWKKTFIHLLRILECIDGATSKLDKRFRDVPTFGRDSIRRFTNNVSELKKLGARDYENLLQCSIPVFEGLLPEKHNTVLMNLLFILAHWHSLAKLQQHTDLSLSILESVTEKLGHAMRNFQEETLTYNTRELKREEKARVKRKASTSVTSRLESANAIDNELPSISEKKTTAGRQRKTFNLNTYKDHSLGDYVEHIRRFGTVDSYSTESIELEHRCPKSRYLRTSRKDFEKQLGRIERRQARIRRIRQKLNESKNIREVFVNEKGPESSTSTYHVGKTQNYPLDLGDLARKNSEDPAAKDFTRDLKEHLFPRIRERLKISAEVFGSSIMNIDHAAQNTIIIKDNRVYHHKLARFYHTTYDLRRSEDVINPQTPHCNIMMLSNAVSSHATPSTASSNHPFLYGRVIAIYHVNVIYTGPGTKEYDPMRFDILHIRWFQLHVVQSRVRGQSGWDSSRLDCVTFPPMAHAESFGFIDPSLVLRGCHLIPAFSLGKKYPDGKGLSRMSRDSNDWNRYYVNRFADRDMAMRYHWGLGIGHKHSNGQDNLNDCHCPIPQMSRSTDDDTEGAEDGTGIADSERDNAVESSVPEQTSTSTVDAPAAIQEGETRITGEGEHDNTVDLSRTEQTSYSIINGRGSVEHGTRVTEDENHISIELPQALPERTSRSTVDGSGSMERRTSVTEDDIIMALPVLEQTPHSTVEDPGAMADRLRAAEGEEDEVVEPPDSEGGSDIYDSEGGSSFCSDEYSDEWDEDDEDSLDLHDTYHPDEQE